MRLIRRIAAVVRRAPAARGAGARHDGAPGAAQHRQLGVRVRQRRDDRLRAADRRPASARARLRSVGRTRRGTACRRSTTRSRSAGTFARCTAGARTSWSHRADPHGPGVPLRRLQVSARADVGRRRAPVARARWAWRSPARSCAGIRMRIGGWASALRSPAASPLIGSQMVELLLGGPIIAGRDALALFRTARVRVPGLLIGLMAVHVWLVLRLGINEWPMPGRLVRRETYLREYHDLTHRDGVPFAPDAIWKDIVFSAVILLAIGVCAYFARAVRSDWRAATPRSSRRRRTRLLLPVAVRASSRSCRRRPRRRSC